VPIKVRFDAIDVERGMILDIKTTGQSAELESFKLTMDGLKYPLSGALYCEMAKQFYGKEFTFYYIVLGKKVPPSCHVYKTSKETAFQGTIMVHAALEKYKTAMKTNCWTEPTKAVKFISSGLKEV
jgi:hypothetical protein